MKILKKKLIDKPYLLRDRTFNLYYVSHDLIYSEGFVQHESFIWNLLLKEIKPEDVFIDIGAHIGEYTLPIAKKCKLVIAFEPEPRNYITLQQNCKLNKLENVYALPIALSSTSGKLKLFRTIGSQGHSLNPKLHKEAIHDVIEVNVDTLDNIVENLKLSIEKT